MIILDGICIVVLIHELSQSAVKQCCSSRHYNSLLSTSPLLFKFLECRACWVKDFRSEGKIAFIICHYGWLSLMFCRSCISERIPVIASHFKAFTVYWRRFLQFFTRLEYLVWVLISHLWIFLKNLVHLITEIVQIFNDIPSRFCSWWLGHLCKLLRFSWDLAWKHRRL